MTIPMVVMIISGLLWFVWEVALPQNSPSPIPRFGGWFIQACRILFAVSAFWVLAGVSGRSVF